MAKSSISSWARSRRGCWRNARCRRSSSAEQGAAMSDIRSLLVHLDATAGSIGRLRLARALAARHGARVTVLYGARPDPDQTDFAYSAGAALSAAERGEG